MGVLLDGLREWGCDVDGALARFLDDEGLYISCLHAVLEDKAFAGLGEALNAHAVKEAFDHAHTLKGVLANMGLTPMYDLTVEIVEPLRAGDDTGLMPAYEELLTARERLAGLLGEQA